MNLSTSQSSYFRTGIATVPGRLNTPMATKTAKVDVGLSVVDNSVPRGLSDTNTTKHRNSDDNVRRAQLTRSKLKR